MEGELDMCCWLAPSQRNVYLNLYLKGICLCWFL
jgi:hypothetical protein